VAEALRRQVRAEVVNRLAAWPELTRSGHRLIVDSIALTQMQAGQPAPYLRVEGLTKDFGNFTALKNVSLAVSKGEFVCFLGPSGCGKTTLLRIIAGLETQTSGQIEQAGRDISDLPPSQRDFGIVFQSYALFPNLTVEQNIAYGLQSIESDRSKIRKRTAELLELVGLPEQGPKYPAQLSGGQQQRIALARALAISPGLLLLDEPLSALDAKVRAYLRHEIKLLQRRLGVTTIMVTHDQEEALSMADRVVVMNHGIIEQTGSPTEIYREPASLFVADFIGSMNKLKVTVRGLPKCSLECQLRLQTARVAAEERGAPGASPGRRDPAGERRVRHSHQCLSRHRAGHGVPGLVLESLADV
jgi:putative 2-aminoethylphosphonate ABC transporter ATP-binding protein